MMAAIPNEELEICIRIDRSTLRVDGTKVAQICANLVRRRFGASVTSAAAVFPPPERVGALAITKQTMASPNRQTTASTTR